MNRTKIEWVRNPGGTPGYVWNPVVGCRGVGGVNCPYCYAAKIWNRFHEKVYSGMESFQDIKWFEDQFNVRFPRRKSRIFVGSMSDIYWWAKDWLVKVNYRICARGGRHQFIFLTKHPEVYDYNNFEGVFADNIILGMTETFQNPKKIIIPRYLNQRSNLKLLSIEPILSDFDPADHADFLKRFDWIIVGCQTGAAKEKTFYPHAMTLTNLRRFCFKNRIALFEKNNLKMHYESKEIFEIEDLIHEFPEVKKCY